MSDSVDALAEVTALGKAYCEAVYFARADVFEQMCHERFQMTHIEDGGESFWTKATFLERVRGRSPGEGAASYGIYSVDATGGEIARVHLWVDVPPARRFEDHLGFVKVGGEWKLLTKVFRTLAKLDEQE
jgi:hypothetical protein